MHSKKNQGFTLLEVMIVTTIIGILAAASTYSIGNFIKEKRSEQHVMALWSELSSLRARAIKDNCHYIVQFNNAAAGAAITYVVYRNDSSNYNINTPFSTAITNGVGAASGQILAGKADGCNSGTNLPGGLPTDIFLSDQWKTAPATKGGLARSIIFEADPLGSINGGTLLIKNSAVKTVGYALTKAPNGHTLKLYKWDGSKWYEM